MKFRNEVKVNLGHFTSAPDLWGWAMSHMGAAINTGELDQKLREQIQHSQVRNNNNNKKILKEKKLLLKWYFKVKNKVLPN